MKAIVKFLMAGAVLMALALGTHAQTTPLRSGSALSNVVSIGFTAVSNLAATLPAPIMLSQGKGIAFTPYYAGGQSTNTGLISFQFAVSTDGGSTYTTTKPIQVTSTGTGAAAVRDYTLIPPTTLNGATHIKLVTITNALVNTGTTTVTNVYWYIPN